MSKVLYIKANIKAEGQSRTFQVSDEFIAEYKKNNPGDEVVTLDLYEEGIDFLKAEDLGAVFGPKTEESRLHPILKYAYQFVEADKYVIAAPLWNLGSPAILKAYFDYVSVTGITFKYGENGPVGMCEGKKAVHIVSRGGAYSEAPFSAFEMGDKYLRTILGFFGIADITTIAAEKMDVMGLDTVAMLEESKASSREIAARF